MSIFGSIMSKIFGDKAPSAAQASTVPSLGGGAKPADAGAGTPPAVAPAPSGGGATPSAGSAATPMAAIDVEEVLDRMEGDGDQELNWRQSIVDLMKLLKLDSGLAARRQLAQELGYSGDTKDTAKMNVWLHKQVMTKLAQNGGKVPADLTH